MRLQGKRRLRTPKMTIIPRIHPDQAAREKKLGQSSVKAPVEATDDADDADDAGDDGIEWGPSMKKAALAKVAESVGIDTKGLTKPQIIKALDKLS